MAGNIDCNLSLFYLLKDNKKPLIFFYHRLKMHVLSFSFRYIMHLRFVSVDKKIRAISVAFIGSFFARILIGLFNLWSILSEKSYHNKTRAAISLFNDFNARRGIATLNSNSMVNDGNYTYSIPRKGTNDRAISSHPTTPFLMARHINS